MSRGLLYSIISRVLFILGGYIIHVYLARLLGPEKYGVFGICIAVITICHVFLSSGVRQVVSKSAAIFPRSAKYFLHKGVLIQLLISSLLGLLVIVLSKNIADFFNDKSLEKPLYMSAMIIIVQSLFFAYMGVFNGLKKFGAENVLLSTYSIIRTIAAIVLVYFGMEVLGGLAGFLIASVVALMLGIVLTSDLPGQKYYAAKVSDLLKSSVPIIVIFSALTFIMNLDLLAVKYFVKGDEFAGYYTSAAAISQLTYRLLIAFGIVLFPFVSASYHENDVKQTQKYIREVVRFSLLVMVPMVFLFCIYANDVVTLVYGSDYHSAGTILRILIWGVLFLGFVSIFSHVMIGIEKEKVMLKYALVGIVLSLAANLLLVPRIGVVGGAISTTISACTVAILSYTYILQNFGITVNMKSVSKVVGALSIMLILSYALSNVDINFILKAIMLYIGYFGILILFREIGSSDINVVQRLVFNTSK